MRIAILTSGILPVPAVQGGAVENLLDFCLAYNDRHHLHDITIYSIYHPEVAHHSALQSQVNHYHYINTSSFTARIAKRLFRYIHGDKVYYHHSVEYFLNRALAHVQKNNYDAILLENRPGYALKIRENTSVPIIIHQENDYINNEVLRGRDIYNSASLIINTSEYITQRVLTICHDDTKCRTVLNGIDVQRFYQATAADRSSVGISKDDFIIVFSGRLTPEKGILQLIQAMKQASHLHNLKLLVIGGSFYGKDSTLTPFIETLKNETLHIQKNVIFTGFINYEEVPSYLKMADIAVVPSMWEEPFGLTIVEAMAAGLPLITTHSGGIPEICTGVATIVERDNIVENLANAITDLYEHPQKREKMAQASLKRSKLFDKDTYARNFFDAIQS